MMKKYLFISLMLLSALTACNRNIRRDQNAQPATQPVTQETAVVQSTSTPIVEADATQTPIPTDIPTIQPTDTVVPTVGVSQSDVLAGQLDALLGQFNTQLQTVDTIPETP